MVVNKVGKDIPQSYAEQYGIYEGELAHIGAYQEASRATKPVKPRETKLLGNIHETIEKTGLRDGMTISFHHHFREGDYVMNLVLAEIAAMRLKNISIAPSLVANIHEPPIEHIRNGVVVNITSSDLRNKVGAAISTGIMENPMVIRSHSGQVRAVAAGDIHIDVAFLDAPSSDAYENANGTKGKITCDSLGYTMVDAKYVDQVVVITNTLVPYPNAPTNIPQTDVDYVVEINAIGDPGGITKGATCFTENPKGLLIAGYAAKIITHSPYYKEGFSFQAGTDGSSLAVTRFMKEQMLKDSIKASFALGGITNAMVELLEEGLVEKVIDVQDFDHPSAVSLGENANHYEIDANMYASPLSKGTVINQLDTTILFALEVDTDFNVNVTTGSDSVIRGASGGHLDTSTVCKMSLVITSLVHGWIPTIVEQVNAVVTPSTSADVVVTKIGIAINPERTNLTDYFKTLGVSQFTLGELKDKVYDIVDTLEPIKYGDKVITLIEY